MKNEVEELTISDCNYLEKLSANGNIYEFKRQLAILKSKGKDTRKYEEKLKRLEPRPIKELTGNELWAYLNKDHGY